MLGLLCTAATGCRHKQTAVYVPVPLATTVPLEKAPEPPLVAQVPVEPGPPLPPKELPPKKVRKPKKKVTPVVVAPAPVEVASSGGRSGGCDRGVNGWWGLEPGEAAGSRGRDRRVRKEDRGLAVRLAAAAEGWAGAGAVFRVAGSGSDQGWGWRRGGYTGDQGSVVV